MKFHVFAALALVVGLATPVYAAPIAPAGVAAPSEVVLVYGCCGPRGHRGPHGHCRAGGQWGGYHHACPAGWHIGPHGRHCWRN